MSKYFLIICSMTFSLCSHAEAIMYTGILKEEINQGGVAEIGIRGEPDDLFFWSGSLMWFAHEDNVYDGFNLSYGLSVGTDLKAYSTVGFYGGKYQACEYDPVNYEEQCENHYTAGVFPELGVQLSLDRFRIAAYSRYYRTFDAGNNEYKMYGIYIGYEL